MVRIGGTLLVPVVTARACLPLPALPGAASDDVLEMALATVTGPPKVVVVAVGALADHLYDLVASIAKLYDT